MSCNQTEALAVMIPQLEEFIDVARSELVCSLLIVCMINAPFMSIVDIRHVLRTFPLNLPCFHNSKHFQLEKAKNQLYPDTLRPHKSN